MGEVYLARRRGAVGVQKLLVIKRVRADRASDPRLYELFVREAHVATALSHSNLVTVFDVGRDEHGPFLAMEYINGPNLAEVLHESAEAETTLDPVVAAHVAAETCAGLHFAHQYRDENLSGLVHRDVTPRNILLSMEGDVKVTDFGVAALAGDSEHRRGTLAYMAPEQANGEPVDARADVFAVGLLLFELLTGTRAYQRDVEEHARAALVPEMSGSASAELQRIVGRATARDPNERFQTARAMQRALSQYILGVSASRRDPEPPTIALSAVLDQLFPDWQRPDREPEGTALAGFPGTTTVLSRAETATVGAESRADPEPPQPSPTPRRLLAIAGVGLTVVALAMLAGPPSRPVAPIAVALQKPAERTGATEPAKIAASAERLPLAASEALRSADSSEPSTERVARPARVADRANEKQPSKDQFAPPKTAAVPGFLNLNAVPWAYVTIDGNKTGETPLQNLELSPGRHRLVIRNPILEMTREIVVEIRAGQTTRRIVDLTRER